MAPRIIPPTRKHTSLVLRASGRTLEENAAYQGLDESTVRVYLNRAAERYTVIDPLSGNIPFQTVQQALRDGTITVDEILEHRDPPATAEELLEKFGTLSDREKVILHLSQSHSPKEVEAILNITHHSNVLAIQRTYLKMGRDISPKLENSARAFRIPFARIGSDALILEHCFPQEFRASIESAQEALINKSQQQRRAHVSAKRPKPSPEEPNIQDVQNNILTLIAGGRMQKEIGQLLNISEDTIGMHLRRANKSYGVDNAFSAARAALKHGAIKIEDVIERKLNPPEGFDTCPKDERVQLVADTFIRKFSQLSSTEQAVAFRHGNGLTVPMIAEALNITENTVDTYLSRCYGKQKMGYTANEINCGRPINLLR